MIIIEYLVFVENQAVKCSDVRTFNNLIQSDPDLTIINNKISNKDITVDYEVQTGEISLEDNHYFHIKFKCENKDKIQNFSKLLRSYKSVLSIISKQPQTLYDGISLYYSELAYPKVHEIESLMRKLITKFMLINVGLSWTKDRVPSEVVSSVRTENKDATYLHNVDFIQLKSFLFSENFPTHKENLINKLKSLKKNTQIDIDEIKSLLPISNWDKFFSDKVSITREQLSKQWEELYELRCKIAHNRTFTKSDLDTVDMLVNKVRDALQGAITNLDKIDIPVAVREDLAENVVSNFNQLYGDFIIQWKELGKVIYELTDCKIINYKPELKNRRSLITDIELLKNEGVIQREHFETVHWIRQIRNQIVHHNETIDIKIIEEAIEDISIITKKFKSWL